MKNKVIRIRERNYRNMYKGRNALQLIVKLAIALLGILLIGSLIYFLLRNRDTIVEEDISEFAMPTVTFFVDDTRVNTIGGQFTRPYEGNCGEYIVPLENDKVYFALKSPFEVTKATYEVTTLDGYYEYDSGRIDLGNNIGKDNKELDEDEELYSFKPSTVWANNSAKLLITLETDEGKVYFPIMLSNVSDAHIKENLELAKGFCDSAINNKDFDKYEKYLESNRDESTESYGHVTLKSTSDYILWSGLDAKMITEPFYYITSVDTGSTGFEIKYRIETTVDDMVQRYFVTENYDISYKDEETQYIMNYDRDLTREFKNGDRITSGRSLELGMGSFEENGDSFKVSDNGKFVSFVMGGALWQYSAKYKTMTKLYPILNEDKNSDLIINSRNIKIMECGNKGSLSFVVCGNCLYGANAGKTGASVYYFEGGTGGRVYEDSFIESGLSAKSLRKNMNKYVKNYHKEGVTYYYKSRCFYKNTGSKHTEIEMFLDSKDFASNRDGSRVAYKSPSGDVTFTDLETDDGFNMKPKDGEELFVIGFSEDNLVYGVAKKSDMITDENDNESWAMYEIRIVDEDNKIVKKYSDDNQLIIKASMIEDNVEITLGNKKGSSYVEDGTEYLTVPVSAVEKPVKISVYGSVNYGICSDIQFADKIGSNLEYDNVNLVSEME